MLLNRTKFFSIIRPKLGPFRQGQVNGFNDILDAWEARYHKQTSVPQLAVCLATAWWETGRTMQPIEEIGNKAYFTRLYGIEGQNPKRARQMGNVNPGDGIKYNGKGLVQLTWFTNYQKSTTRLRELGIIDKSVDFTKKPELVKQMIYAIPIMFIGMEEGWFTGRKLDDIVDDQIDGDEYADFLKSRAIINGKDRDKEIAGFAMTFLSALSASVDMKEPAAAKIRPAEVPRQTSEVPGASAWNRFWTTVAELAGKQGKA